MSTGEGGCCPNGMVMVEGMCMATDKIDEEVTSGGCGCHHSSGTDSDDADAEEDDEDENEMDRQEDIDIDLKIRYGQCYRLTTLPDGKEVGSNRENRVYTPGGLFKDIPFRVCRSTRDCSEGNGPDDDVVFASRSRFFLQDQMGKYNDPKSTPGWVSTSTKTRGVLKMKFTAKSDEATTFTGLMGDIMSSSCDDCSVLKVDGIPPMLQFSPVECAFTNQIDSDQRRMEDEL
ncbi:hypothetical protein D9758_010466 [Tetrapyrgos nigripes]|uniref:Uncharacterized protein n=1 Tax=Tetrapyrgos nigripes TaxID=182062 RepID=A0A8H5CR00_9AGAR|nr:hypothetical protein D9758_010466 [Tetrapyrgos nigripes]